MDPKHDVLKGPTVLINPECILPGSRSTELIMYGDTIFFSYSGPQEEASKIHIEDREDDVHVSGHVKCIKQTILHD